MKSKKIAKRLARKKRIKEKVFGNDQKPRLSVFRSSKHIYAQIIDDEKGKTLLSFNSILLDRDKKTNKDDLKTNYLGKMKTAYLVGYNIAKLGSKKKINKVSFDRGGYRYHGRVKTLAEGARAGGLDF